MDTTLCTDEIDDVHIPQLSDDAGSQGEWDPHQATSSRPAAAVASPRVLSSPITDSLRTAMADTQGSFCDDGPSMSQTGPPAHPGCATPSLPMPHSASPLQQQLAQQHPPQHGASDQHHSQQQQQPAPCTNANRQSTAPLLQSQAQQPSQPTPGRTSPSAAVPAATAVPLRQPQAATDHTQSSSAMCSDRPADCSHSTGNTTSNMPPEHLSDSITITMPQERQQASDTLHSRGLVQGGVRGRVSQAASRAQADQGPQDGEAPPEAQLQGVSGALLPQSQPQALPQVQPPQDVSHSAAQEQTVPQLQSQAHLLMPHHQPSHVPNPGVFGDEDDPTRSPDSPTPTLHYSPGPIAHCDGPTDLGDTERQSAQVSGQSLGRQGGQQGSQQGGQQEGDHGRGQAARLQLLPISREDRLRKESAANLLYMGSPVNWIIKATEYHIQHRDRKQGDRIWRQCMCGKHKHGGYCCSYQPWQHAYCAVVNKGSPPWHNTIFSPGGGVDSQQGQAGAYGNLAQSQHVALPGIEQGHSGSRSQGLLGTAPGGEASIGPQGRAETGVCVQGQPSGAGVSQQLAPSQPAPQGHTPQGASQPAPGQLAAGPGSQVDVHGVSIEQKRQNAIRLRLARAAEASLNPHTQSKSQPQWQSQLQSQSQAQSARLVPQPQSLTQLCSPHQHAFLSPVSPQLQSHGHVQGCPQQQAPLPHPQGLSQQPQPAQGSAEQMGQSQGHAWAGPAPVLAPTALHVWFPNALTAPYLFTAAADPHPPPSRALGPTLGQPHPTPSDAATNSSRAS
ncbi:hypothetical protein ABBQ32_010564 [Trebouxia sp. C0010 RCD-2024]